MGEKICGTDEMKFITILCTRSATHLMRGTGEVGRSWGTGRHPGSRSSPFTLNTQCVALSNHGAGERAKEPWTLSPAAKWRSGVVH